jgi:hypothetical protein
LTDVLPAMATIFRFMFFQRWQQYQLKNDSYLWGL